MGIIDKIKGIIPRSIKKEVVDEDHLYTSVIYNTHYNLMILISYSSNYFQSMIEFINACAESNIKVILSHSAIEKEETAEEKKDFDKKPVVLIHNRYYALISGLSEDYVNIYKHIDNLSNDILSMITLDIYNSCTSTYFDEIIEYGILEMGRFKYQNIEPKYDKYAGVKSAPRTKCSYFDDIEAILSKLPECYKAIQLVNAVNVYMPSEPIMTAANLVKIFTTADNSAHYEYYIDIFLPSLYSHFIKEPTKDTIQTIIQPKFLINELDEDEQINANMPLEALDEIFQQSYDRFNAITSDAIIYEDIDEQLASNNET